MGEPLLQGFENLAQGVQQYNQIKQQERVVSGQLDAMLQQGGMSGLTSLSQNGQKLAQKFLGGKATVNDKMQLLGEAQSSIALRQQSMQMQQQKIALDRANMLNNFMQSAASDTQGQPQPQQQGTAQPPPPSASQFMPQPGQQSAQAPQGAPPAAPIGVENLITPPTAVTATSPEIVRQLPRLALMAGGDMSKIPEVADAAAGQINKQRQEQYSQALAVEKPTGRMIYQGPDVEHTSGLVQGNRFAPEMVKGPGTDKQSYSAGSQTVIYAPNTKPPQPFVLNPGDRVPASMDTINGLAQNVTNAPGWQTDVKAAQDQTIQSGASLGESNLLVHAAKAYAQGGSSNFNMLRGNPIFANLQNLFTGQNPAGALKTAIASNTGAILAQIKNNAGGTVGGRMLQSEFEGLKDMLATGEMDNPTIVASAMNMQKIMQQKYDLANSYAQYRKHNTPEDAEDLAMKQFGSPIKLTSPGDYNNIPKPVVQHFKQIMADPALTLDQKQAVAKAFDQAKGNGMAELALSLQ